jgi:HicA toxin of bacterial toxin-antitoxin,
MSKREKLLKRLLSKPKDFTFDELVTLLSGLGYEADNKGKTSGSRILFENKLTGKKLNIHKPHPKQILKPYQVNHIIDELKNAGAI